MLATDEHELTPPEHRVFGPVPSRRFGLSLGVDVVPYKTCCFDCIYCQIGRTTRLTTERKPWVPVEAVLEELKGRLDPRPDYITFSGSGEPTLYSELGTLIRRIKAMTDIPVAVLTNGALLSDPAVREDLMAADVLAPSLDAGDEAVFRAVNRPADGLRFEDLVRGLVELRGAFRGAYWLEVFLLAGYTGRKSELAGVIEAVRSIRPDKVHLNTVTRPPAETFASPVSPLQMEELAGLFTPRAEVIVDGHEEALRKVLSADRAGVLALLKRHPCTMDDLVRGLGLERETAERLLAGLLRDGRIVLERSGERDFYLAAQARAGS